MFARTQRLLLRPAWAEDEPALTSALADEMIARNLVEQSFLPTTDKAEQFLAEWATTQPSRFLMIKRTASAPRLIGGIGLDDEGSSARLGYWISRPYWGLGFATEAGRHMVELARMLGYRQLRAHHFADNPASGAVLRKLGFRPTGSRPARHDPLRGQEAISVEYAYDLSSDDQPGPRSSHTQMREMPRWPAEKREAWRQYAA